VYPANVRPMCLKTSLMRPRCNSKFVQGLGAPHTTPNLCRVYILELMGTNTTTDSGGGGLTRIHTYHAQPPPVSSDAILTKNSHICGALGVRNLCACSSKCQSRHVHDFLGCSAQQCRQFAHKTLPPCPYTTGCQYLGTYVHGLERPGAANSLSIPDTEDL
jgi:hypothetical protein